MAIAGYDPAEAPELWKRMTALKGGKERAVSIVGLYASKLEGMLLFSGGGVD